ncbi:MAG: acyltransferase [Paracoccaceae bacterium]
MTRIHSIDLLKLIVAIGVVWAHATLTVGNFSPAIYVFGQGLVRMTVPIFALISGFLFHSTFTNARIKGWLLRLLAVYLFWCLFYFPFWKSEGTSLTAILEQLVFGPLHLWYMAALGIALALLTVVIKLSHDDAQANRRLLWLAIAGLLLGSALQVVDFLTSFKLPLNAYRNGLFVGFPYAAFGFLIARHIHRHGMARLPGLGPLVAVLLLLALLRMAEAWLALQGFGMTVVPDFPPLALAFAITTLLVTLRLDLPPAPVNLGFLSMMLYFLHMAVIFAALHFGLDDPTALFFVSAALPGLFGLLLIQALRALQARLPGLGDRNILGWRHIAPRQPRPAAPPSATTQDPRPQR